jgi:hypothetical protein
MEKYGTDLYNKFGLNKLKIKTASATPTLTTLTYTTTIS